MNEKHFATYTAEICAEFGPEWSPLGHKAAKAHVAKLHESAIRWGRNMEYAKGIYEKNKTDGNRRYYLEEVKKCDAAIGEYYKAKDLLDTGEVYGTMAPVEHTNYIACDSEISLADLYDIRHDTNGKAPRIVAERYDDTAAASATNEGNTIDKIDFADCVYCIKDFFFCQWQSFERSVQIHCRPGVKTYNCCNQHASFDNKLVSVFRS